MARKTFPIYPQNMTPVNVDSFPIFRRVFRISEEYAAKPLNILSHNNSISALEYELRILRLAYQAGVHVPRPDRIYQVTLPLHNEGENINTLALVMEYIEGLRLIEMLESRHPQYDTASAAFDAEKQNALDLGFEPNDCHHHNAIWNRERGLYLIDLREWRKK